MQQPQEPRGCGSSGPAGLPRAEGTVPLCPSLIPAPSEEELFFGKKNYAGEFTHGEDHLGKEEKASGAMLATFKMLSQEQ